jgi:hypothetical protein
VRSEDYFVLFEFDPLQALIDILTRKPLYFHVNYCLHNPITKHFEGDKIRKVKWAERKERVEVMCLHTECRLKKLIRRDFVVCLREDGLIIAVLMLRKRCLRVWAEVLMLTVV